jgi:hypothetical protein
MRLRLLAALVAGAAALAGCGIGSGKDQGGGADLRVTRDFGHRPIADVKRGSVREGDTVMRFLQSEQKVTLRYGGGFVQSIDGLSGRGATGNRDWFYWVNGKEGSVGAADSKLNPGDVVQWDYRDWSTTMSIPAIVGAFPEPFLHGFGGKKQPVRLECADSNAPACNTARDKLTAAGIVAPSGALGTAERGQLARVLVGPWSDLRGLRVLRVVEQGPQASGVFARFAQNGARLDLLDTRGRVAERGGPGAGLVAAIRIRQEESIVFIVTGTDAAGVESAADALTADKLRDAFAVTTRGPSVRKLPFVAGTG